MKKGNNTISSIFKGSKAIGTIVKGTLIVYEAFKPLIASGVPPITLQKCKGANLVDYKFYGNSVQNGTPTPETPIEVESVGDKTKNLFDMNGEIIQKYQTDISIEGNTIIATSTSTGNFFNAKIKIPDIEAGTTVTLSAEEITASNTNIARLFLAYYDVSTNTTTTFKNLDSAGAITVTIPEKTSDTQELCLLLYSNVNGTNDVGYYCTYKNIQLEIGNTATEYEPYGYKIPVKVRGKNLFDMEEWYRVWSDYDANNITKLSYQDKECYLVNMSRFYNTDYVVEGIKENTQYTLSAEFISGTGNVGFRIYYTDGTKSDMTNINATEWTKFSITSTANKTIQSIRGCGAFAGNIYVSNIQLEVESETTDYEPYIDPITTNIYLKEPLRKVGDYADYIDFENQKVVRNIGKYTLTGDETSWTTNNTGVFYFNTNVILPNLTKTPLELVCNQYKYDGSKYTSTISDLTITNNAYQYETSQYKILFKNSNYTSLDDFKTYLKELTNPVKINYVIDSSIPLIEDIELPNIPTHKGTNIIEVGTKVNSSNMEVIYYGKGKLAKLEETENIVLNDILGTDTETELDITDTEINQILDEIIGG